MTNKFTCRKTGRQENNKKILHFDTKSIFLHLQTTINAKTVNIKDILKRKKNNMHFIKFPVKCYIPDIPVTD